MKFILLGLTLTAALLTGHALYNAYYSQNTNLKDYHNEFHLWTSLHKISAYSSLAEKEYRMNVWAENLKKVKHHNNFKNSTYKMGMNKFADLTKEEFTKRYTGLNVKDLKNSIKANPRVKLEKLEDIDSIDWVSKGKVTSIKDQANCGSCWAFSVTGALESFNMIFNNAKEQSFSPQYLIDCDKDRDDEGCDGGNFEDAFTFCSESGVVPYEKYRYRARDGICKKRRMQKKNLIQYINKGFASVPEDDNDAMVATLQRQPISVAIDGSNIQMYDGGIFDDYCETDVNHAVLLVGYGEEDGTKFYKVKNSWGDMVGENGYYRIIRTEGMSPGKCGIATYTAYPTA